MFETVADMCQFGVTSTDRDGTGPAIKPTRLLTSSISIRDSLARRCGGGHRHVQLVSGRAGPAQQYTVDFCDAIIDGLAIEALAATT